MFEMMLGGGKTPVPTGNIAKFDTGAAGIVALSKSGRLYSIGDQYVSGTGATVTEWTLLTSGVENFWLSYRSLLIKMLDGRWLFLGANNMFPTSFGSTITTLTDMSAYMQYPADLVIKSVSLGMRSVAVVFTNGQYAMCGQNSFGGLGVGNITAVRTLTMRTDFTTVDKIKFDLGANDTSYLLLTNGRLYVAGASDYGQAGTISSSVLTWRLQSLVTKDFFPSQSGVYMVVDTGSVFAVYVQGRQFDGSLGTGATADTSYQNPTAVWQNITDRTKGMPVIYSGIYSSRVTHPVTGVLYFTGTNSGQSQGTGDTQTKKYSFTAMPGTVLQGEYSSLRANYSASYLVIDGNLYGTGQVSGTGLLPGLGNTRSNIYVPLDTTLVI